MLMSSAAMTAPRLLLAEIDPVQLIIFREVLEEEGYSVTAAASLSASQAALDEQLFHLVLTDTFHQKGQPFLQNIGPLLAHASPTPVGVLTSWPVPEEMATQAGAAFLLHKPFELDDLMRAVQRELAPRPAVSRERLVRAFFAALSQHDWARMERLCTPDLAVVSITAPPPEAPGARRGLLNNLPLLEKRLFALPETTIVAVQCFDSPLGLAARYLMHWHPRDDVEHRLSGALHFRFQGERISQIEGSF
jgi:CheY-like chemotaxis protein